MHLYLYVWFHHVTRVWIPVWVHRLHLTHTCTDLQNAMGKLGRLMFPAPLLAYPFYLWGRSPGKAGSHFDPDCDLFVPSERSMVNTTNAFLLGMLGILAACTYKFGVMSMFNLYFMPYWGFVIWLDVVTYLHHHGSHDVQETMPWYRCVWRDHQALFYAVCNLGMRGKCVAAYCWTGC